MLPGRVLSWISTHRLLSAGIALAVLTAAVAFAIVDRGDDVADLAEPGPQVEATTPPDEAATDEGDEAADASRRSNAVVGGRQGERGDETIPGLGGSRAGRACTPRKVDEVGVTDDTITIGQVVTDSNQIPQQFRPAHEGLQAFIKRFNASGGLCKRKLALEYRNDNLNAAIHSQDMRELADRVLAFVANESLFDQLDYEQQPPFEPTVRGRGGPVPDVGGLAFSYSRSQSAWHAGVIGSVSPVLVGGGQYKFFLSEARSRGTPCRKGAVVYLREPTGASEDQARLGRVSLEQSWGGNLGRGNTQLYATNLIDSTPFYESLVDRMVADGMNCVFSYTDLQSSINLARAMNNRGVWPPSTCRRGPQCFRVAYIPLSAYDAKFIQDAGNGAISFSTFIPHAPLAETSHPAMTTYLDALRAVPGARPSTFSVLGFASGAMLIEALGACPAAPTRACLMSSLRKMKDFTAGGLLGGTTPFRTTRASFDRYGTHNWKWIFNQSVGMRVAERGGKRDFYRINPRSGFFSDTLKVARGRAA